MFVCEAHGLKPFPSITYRDFLSQLFDALTASFNYCAAQEPINFM